MQPRKLLYPFSVLYAAGMRIRNTFFEKGILKQNKFDLPVIVIGNLTTGGTGKTPHVEYVASLLSRNYKVAILSRGYGRKTKGFLIAGKGVTSDQVGDEPMQYFSKLDKVTVCVCEDRVAGITKLLEQPMHPEVVIMDDGFQHRYVNPGLKILLTSYNNLYTRDHLLPAGNLREPRSGASRADCIIVTKTPAGITVDEKNKIRSELKLHQGQELYFSSLRYGSLISFYSSDEIKLASISGYNVTLFAGIADPQPLEQLFKRNAKRVQSIFFSDHHVYSAGDMDKLRKKTATFVNENSIIVTTEKDFHRLKGTAAWNMVSDLPLYYIPVTVLIDEQEKFNQLIDTYVGKYKKHS